MDQLQSTTMKPHRKGARLTFEERVIIQTCLRDKHSLRSIAREIGCAVNTVRNEILRQLCVREQSPWRFQEKGKIILASGDMYRCFDKAQPFDIGNDCNSIYDHKVKVIDKKLAYGAKVVDVHIPETGDITLLFENQLSFQGFIDDSMEDEYWRFISYEKEKSEHIVFHDID